MPKKAVCVFIAVFISTARCQVCRPRSVEACYGAIAIGLLRGLVKPPFGEIELDASMQEICKRRLPRVSRCLSIVHDCPRKQRDNFRALENAYRGLHNVVCTQTSFDGLRNLWDCLDRPRRKKCNVETDDFIGAEEKSLILHCQMARNYSTCLEDVTRDCPPSFDNGKKALKKISKDAVDILCSSPRDVQPISTQVSPSAPHMNKLHSCVSHTSTSMPFPITPLHAVDNIPTTSASRLEASTAFMNLGEHEPNPVGQHGGAMSPFSVFVESATVATGQTQSSVNPNMSTSNTAAGHVTPSIGGEEASGSKGNKSNVEKQPHIVLTSTAASVLTVASVDYALVCVFLLLAL